MELSERDLDRIVEMAWEDRTPFDAIHAQFQVSEQQVIKLMRKQLSEKGFKRWRKHVQGRVTKHRAKAPQAMTRHKCSRQRATSLNKY